MLSVQKYLTQSLFVIGVSFFILSEDYCLSSVCFLHLFDLENGSMSTGDEPVWKDEGLRVLYFSSLGVRTGYHLQ